MEDFEDDIHPSQEIELYVDWALTCFGWQNVVPTKEMLDYVRENWYPGKAPIDGVNEALRKFK